MELMFLLPFPIHNALSFAQSLGLVIYLGKGELGSDEAEFIDLRLRLKYQILNLDATAVPFK